MEGIVVLNSVGWELHVSWGRGVPGRPVGVVTDLGWGVKRRSEALTIGRESRNDA